MDCLSVARRGERAVARRGERAVARRGEHVVARLGAACFGKALHAEGAREWHLRLWTEEPGICHRFKTSPNTAELRGDAPVLAKEHYDGHSDLYRWGAEKVVKILIKIIVTTFDIRNGFFMRNNDKH